MKKTLALVAISAAAALFSSCMNGMWPIPIGAVYADATDPVAATGNAGHRKGTSSATSYLGIIGVGDASIAAAKAQGGLSTVSTVDRHRKNILGIITTYTTTVTGN